MFALSSFCSTFLTVFMTFFSYRRTPLQDIPCDSIEDASQWCREAFQEKVNIFFHNNMDKYIFVLLLSFFFGGEGVGNWARGK